MTFFFWSSLHFGQEIGHLGSDALLCLVFTSLHFTVVGENLSNRAGVSNLLNHPPPNLEKWQKMVNFAESPPPMRNIDLHPCVSVYCNCGSRRAVFRRQQQGRAGANRQNDKTLDFYMLA